jgi:hypothetical protein
MTERDQIQAFADDLDKLVGRYCDEFDLTTASAVGVLAFKMHNLMAHAQKNQEDEDEGLEP